MEDAEHTDHPGSVTTMPALKSLPMDAQEHIRSYLSGESSCQQHQRTLFFGKDGDVARNVVCLPRVGVGMLR